MDWREGCKQEVVNFTKFIFNGHLKTGRQAEILTGGNAQNKKASIVNFVDIEATFGTVPFPYSYIHRFKGYLLSTSFVLQIFTNKETITSAKKINPSIIIVIFKVILLFFLNHNANIYSFFKKSKYYCIYFNHNIIMMQNSLK